MSTLKVNTLEEATAGGATFFTAKAWAVYDQYTTQTLLDSGAVSSISDLATGKTRVTFSNAFSNSNYSVAGATGGGGSTTASGAAICFDSSPATLPTTTHSDLDSFLAGSGNKDYNYNSVLFTA